MKRATELKNKARREFRRFGPGSSTAVSSTAVSSTAVSSTAVSSTLVSSNPVSSNSVLSTIKFFDSMQKYKNNVLPLALPKPSSHA